MQTPSFEDSQNDAQEKKNTRPYLLNGLMMGSFCAFPFSGLTGGAPRQKTFFIVETKVICESQSGGAGLLLVLLDTDGSQVYIS